MELSWRSTIYTDVMTVLTAIGLWKILEDDGIEGWKALIPFYSSYLFGEVAGVPEKGRKQMWAEIFACIFGAALIVFAILMYGYNTEYVGEPGTGVVGFKVDPPMWMTVTTVVLTILTLFFVFRAFVFYLSICSSYNQMRNAPGWFMVLWIFAKGLAMIYFAFIHDHYDIQGLSTKKDPDTEE